MTDAKDEIHPCNCCGLPTHLDDLDAKDDGIGGNLVPIQSLTAKELRDRYAIAKRLQTRGKQPY